MEIQGILGLAVLILDIWVITRILASSAGTGSKILWILLVIMLPVVGVILWMLLGP
jgi:hypothetical protein